MTPFRETILEEDAKINSTERAAAWAQAQMLSASGAEILEENRQWTRTTQAPRLALYQHWVIRFFVRAVHPWYGEIGLWHRITNNWVMDPKSGLWSCN